MDNSVTINGKTYVWNSYDPEDVGCSECDLRKQCEKLEESKHMLCDVLFDLDTLEGYFRCITD